MEIVTLPGSTLFLLCSFQAFTRSDWIWQVMRFSLCREEVNDDNDDDFDEDDAK